MSLGMHGSVMVAGTAQATIDATGDSQIILDAANVVLQPSVGIFGVGTPHLTEKDAKFIGRCLALQLLRLAVSKMEAELNLEAVRVDVPTKPPGREELQ